MHRSGDANHAILYVPRLKMTSIRVLIVLRRRATTRTTPDFYWHVRFLSAISQSVMMSHSEFQKYAEIEYC